MADKFHFSLVSPERELMSREVDNVEVPAGEGMMGILAGHAPMMTVLAPGKVIVRDGDKTDELFVRGGFAEVNSRGLTILAEDAHPVSELDMEIIERGINFAKLELDKSVNDPERAERARLDLQRMQDARILV